MMRRSQIIRKADTNDATTLCNLAMRSKGFWGYDSDFMAYCREELNFDSAYINRHCVYVLENDDGILGFYSLETLNHTEIELGALFVEPDHIRQGLGRTLLQHAILQSKKQGYEHLVIQGDLHAELFYEKMGANKIGEKESSSIRGRMLPMFKIDLNR